MGNDIFSAFINRKKIMTLKIAEVFFKYTISDKNKLNKTLEKIIDIYLQSFYCSNENDFSKLDNYLSLEENNDVLLKETLLSSIIFYNENNLREKIDNDISTIIILSNIIYLSIMLGDINKKNENIEEYIKYFFERYKIKIRIIDKNKISELKKELLEILKEEFNSFKKFFKLFDSLQFSIIKDRILDFNDGYFVNINYNIKMLSKFSEKEISHAILNKGIDMDNEIISIELTVLEIIKDLINGKKDVHYFIPLQLQCFEKLKHKQAIENIMKNKVLQGKITFVFEGNQIKEHQKTINLLSEENYSLAINKTHDLKVSKNTFDKINYVFVNPNFLECYRGYIEIWKAKKIRFIVSGDY